MKTPTKQLKEPEKIIFSNQKDERSYLNCKGYIYNQMDFIRRKMFPNLTYEMIADAVMKTAEKWLYVANLGEQQKKRGNN